MGSVNETMGYGTKKKTGKRAGEYGEKQFEREKK